MATRWQRTCCALRSSFWIFRGYRYRERRADRRGCTARLTAQLGRVLALCEPSNTTFGTSVDEVGLGNDADRPLAFPATLLGTLDDALVLDIIICPDHCCLRNHLGRS